MPSRRNRGRQTLTQGLDKEVYQVARNILDRRKQYDDHASKLSFATIYDEIKISNSSLNRKNKKVLEDSVERVLETIQQDEQDTEADSLEGFADAFEGQIVDGDRPASNGLNRSIVSAWSRKATKGSMTPKREQDVIDHAKATSEPDPAPTNKRRQANGEPLAKKRKATPAVIEKSPPTHVSLRDVGGVDNIIRQLKNLLFQPMKRPAIFTSSEIQPPRGILLHGPPGCGKTMIANAFAATLQVNFISISAPSIVSGMSGESEKALRDHFEEAKKSAPCIIFIDEIDVITPKRESAQREMEKRIVAQLATCMDDLALEKTDGKPVIVLAATNRPDSLDPALRRGGRFDKEINMTVPSEPVREQILRALTRRTTLSDDVDFELLAKRTPGFVGADLKDLVSTASAAALERDLDILEENSKATAMEVDQVSTTEVVTSTSAPISPEVASLERLVAYVESHPPSIMTSPLILVTQSDFLAALPQVQPSALREGFATIPTTTFADIGALSHHRSELFSSVILPISQPKLYTSIGLLPPSGLLLWGPPGCGKTLLAKAVANESRANFISVKGPELLNKFVGESERAVRQVFNRARSSVPVVIFFDELDALVPRRESGMGEASARVVNTLLTELDGVGGGREGIYVLAATNRPDIVDPAMMRPGRLETLLYVGLPGVEERVEILKTLTRNLKDFAFTENIAGFARSCAGFSGADLESLVRRAAGVMLKRRIAMGQGILDDVGITLEEQDFKLASEQVRRSVSEVDMKKYDSLRKQWADGLR